MSIPLVPGEATDSSDAEIVGDSCYCVFYCVYFFWGWIRSNWMVGWLMWICAEGEDKVHVEGSEFKRNKEKKHIK